MSDFHILKQDDRHRGVSVVFHFAIPDTDNAAGISWQNAVVLEQGGASAIVSVLPGVTPVEDSALKAGSLLEKVEQVRFSTVNLTNAQRLTEIQAQYAERQTEIVAEKQVTLDFTGYEGSAA